MLASMARPGRGRAGDSRGVDVLVRKYVRGLWKRASCLVSHDRGLQFGGELASAHRSRRTSGGEGGQFAVLEERDQCFREGLLPDNLVTIGRNHCARSREGRFPYRIGSRDTLEVKR